MIFTLNHNLLYLIYSNYDIVSIQQRLIYCELAVSIEKRFFVHTLYRNNIN